LDIAGLDNEGLDIDGLDNDGRIWATDCNQLKITIERFYQLTGTYDDDDDDDDGRINFNVAYSPKTARTRNS